MKNTKNIKDKKKPRTRKVNYAYVHKLSAGVSLLALVVILFAGIMGEARTITIAYRAAGAIILIGLISRVVVRILTSYEEMQSGKV